MLTNGGIFKIIERKHGKQQNPEYIYFDLDRYFHFANRISNQIGCSNQEPFKDGKVGDTIRIDLNGLIGKDTSRHDCTIKSVEVAHLVNETELPRIQVENSFTGSFSSQPQLPPVGAVETGNYRGSSENTDLVSNEESQTTIQQQQRHFPPKKK